MEEIIKQVQLWISAPVEKRDVQQGALLIRQCLHNPAFANALIHYPQRTMGAAVEELGKWATVRSQEITHEQVEQMQKVVQVQQPATVAEHCERMLKGKRADHDQLPEEIQMLYKENQTLMRRMRVLHERLLDICRRGDTTVCKDGDSYPVLKELIEADTRYHKNWKQYDTYTL